ncbi:Alpha/Beta hydrolase protein [Abortiporus biennis]|nr:Alpha/Beta hydrolase protein [Abortiporus biennis]
MSVDHIQVTSKKTTKLYVPHPDVPEVPICGVLEQVEPSTSTEGREIGLILHGAMGHKDYLFQKRLGLRLPIDSFRFDFRGNHETPGPWRAGAFLEDVRDLDVVVEYLKRVYGYKITLLVAHSRGVIASFRWLCTSPDAKNVKGFVNVAGRYRLERIYDTADREALRTQGFYKVTCPIAGKPTTFTITKEHLEEFSAFDTSLIWDKFPSHVHVLTLHGMGDRVVPPYDATIHARALSTRTPGTHNLAFVEDADHNFIGYYDVVISTILEWWDLGEHDSLKNGVWKTGVRGKL